MRVIEKHLTDTWRAAVSDPILTALAVLLAYASFVNAPMVVLGVHASWMLNAALWLMIVGAVVVLAPPAVVMLVGVLAVAMGVLEVVEQVDGQTLAVWYLRLSLMTLFLATLIFSVGIAVFAPGRVTYHRLLGAIVLYMAIAHLFVAPYQLIALMAPGAFIGVPSENHGPVMVASLIYFSYTTLTSTGYGDITPVHPLARGIANLEAVIGQFYVAILLARLVTLHAEGRHR